MLKKIFGIIAAFVFLLIAVACEMPGGNDKDDDKQNNGGNQTDVSNYEYKTPVTDSYKLTASYEGKNFLTDGIGEVKVAQYIDGDTTSFRLASGGSNFNVRYNGVNTPESTYRVDPWGYAASKFTKSKLKAASKIVLQAEDMDNRTDNNGRYLAWVWLIDEKGDSRLLNLEIVEMALGYGKANSTSLENKFLDALYDVSNAGCRIYGEKDPDYDYSNEAKVMSIREIKETYGSVEQCVKQEHKGTRVIVNGVVARMNGTNSCYIQQYDEETNDFYGVYIYGGFSQRDEFAIGNSIVLQAKIGYYFGSLQLTEPTSIKLRSWAGSDPDASINVKQLDDLTEVVPTNTLLIGNVVELHNLTVYGGKDADNNNAFTIYCKGIANNAEKRIDVRVDNGLTLLDEKGEKITSYTYFSGKTFKSLKAVVSYYDYDNADYEEGDDVLAKYDGYIQLMLTRVDDYVIE